MSCRHSVSAPARSSALKEEKHAGPCICARTHSRDPKRTTCKTLAFNGTDPHAAQNSGSRSQRDDQSVSQPTFTLQLKARDQAWLYNPSLTLSFLLVLYSYNI